MLNRKMISMAAGFALALLIGGAAQAEEKPYRDRISGTAAPSSFDANGDGVPGHYVTFTGQSTLGPVHGGLLVEYDFLNVKPDLTFCPADRVRVPIIVSASTRATTSQVDQVFMKDDASSARFCLDPMTGRFTMSIKGEFIGGMGKYAEASGSYTYEGTGKVALTDNFGLPFGGFEIRTEGVLKVGK